MYFLALGTRNNSDVYPAGTPLENGSDIPRTTIWFSIINDVDAGLRVLFSVAKITGHEVVSHDLKVTPVKK